MPPSFHRFRRLARLLLLFLLLVAGASSCKEWRNPGPTSREPRKIKVMASDGWIYDVIGENAKLFEKETGIKVSFTIYAPHAYFRALKTMLDSGEAADIFLMQSTRWYLGNEIDPVKYCMDFSGEEWTKRIKPDWLPVVSHRGRVYGSVLWDDLTGWVYTYNDAIFAKLGLKPPENY